MKYIKPHSMHSGKCVENDTPSDQQKIVYSILLYSIVYITKYG